MCILDNSLLSPSLWLVFSFSGIWWGLLCVRKLYSIFLLFKPLLYWTFLAAAAKLLQSCPTLCDPPGSPPGSPVPGILQARTLDWVAISFSNAWKWKVKGKSLSRVWLLATPWTAAYQAPPSLGFSRQEYWSGVPLPSPVGKAGWIQISLLYLSSFSTQCSLKLRNKFGTAKKFTWLKSSYSNFFPLWEPAQ